MMETESLPLPIRLVPRRRGTVGQLMVGVVMAIFFSGFFLLGGDLPIVGRIVMIVFLLGPLWMVVTSALKLLPRSPFYHLEVSASGLLVREKSKRQLFAWNTLPVLEMLTVETKRGTTKHYVVAMDGVHAPSDAEKEEDSHYLSEVLRISADEYGPQSDEHDAIALVAWFNELRALALDNRLNGSALVTVPAPFQKSAISVAVRPQIGATVARG